MTTTAATEDAKVSEFLLAHGGPFYELQRRLGLLHESALRSGTRAAIFVALAWGVPLILSLVTGNAYGPFADKPCLLDPGVWSRFLIAVGLFVLVERQVEEQLRAQLGHFARAPILAPESFAAAAGAVTRALKRRDSHLAELVCFVVAALASVASVVNILNGDASSWAVQVLPDGSSVTASGWWCVFVSSPIFWFLLLRGLWRHLVWSMLLRELAALKLRLVATHPDGHGGLSFIGEYPNAYAAFIFGLSCVLGAALAKQLLQGALAPTVYGYVLAIWLLIVLAMFAYPLIAFHRPLAKLKEQSLLFYGAQATRFHRAAERKSLNRNVAVTEDDLAAPESEVIDPSKQFEAARKLSPLLISRTALLPVSIAALLPLVAAGATQLPLKELLHIVKRLILL